MGVPGCFVVTTEFRSGAESQSAALGFEPAIVWVEHPIQNKTADELAALADSTIAAIMDQLTAADAS